MRPKTAAPYLAVVFILTVIIVTGPLFQEYQFGNAATGAIADGSANVTIIDAPTADGVSLTKGAFGSGRYILRAPSIVVDVSNVTGRPMLTYKVEATNLGFSRSAYIVLGPDKTGRHEITFKEETFAPARVTNDSYIVELSIVLRASGKRTLYSENVTVPVEG